MNNDTIKKRVRHVKTREEKAEAALEKAVDSESNLQILKAMQKCFVEMVKKTDDQKDKMQIFAQMRAVTSDITKLEGINDREDSQFQEAELIRREING